MDRGRMCFISQGFLGISYGFIWILMTIVYMSFNWFQKGLVFVRQ